MGATGEETGEQWDSDSLNYIDLFSDIALKDLHRSSPPLSPGAQSITSDDRTFDNLKSGEGYTPCQGRKKRHQGRRVNFGIKLRQCRELYYYALSTYKVHAKHKRV